MSKARDLFAACRDGRLQTVQRLVESRKVFPSTAVDDRCNNFTALHHAAMKGHLPVVKYLIGREDCGFDLKSKVGKTALNYASDNGRGEVAAFLSEHQAKKKQEEREKVATHEASEKAAGGIQLSEEHYSYLFEQLKEHAAKWKMIGANLGFRTGELDNIQSKTTNLAEAPASYLGDVLSQWFQWAPDAASKRNYATFGALQSAVRRAGLPRAAAELKIKQF